MDVRKFIVLIGFLYSYAVSAQHLNVSHSFVGKLSLWEKPKFTLSYSMGLTYEGLIGSDNYEVYPALNVKTTIFNNQLGESIAKSYGSILNGSFILSGGIIAGCGDTTLQYISLVSNTYANTFEKVRKYSVGLFKSYIFQSNFKSGQEKGLNFKQAVGAFTLNIRGCFLGYYNDGGYGLNKIGDAYDRYWTSGLSLGYVHLNDEDFRKYELTFEKFTGFSKGAYKIGGLLGLDNVLYDKPRENTLNSGQVSFSFSDYRRNIFTGINLMNIAYDPQDIIHEHFTGDPYHQKLEKFYIDFSFGYLTLRN